MEVVGDRWSILLLREAYYGTKRFDEFQYYLGVAPNILSGRQIKYPILLSAQGKPLQLEDVEIVAGSGAVPFNRKRFGAQLTQPKLKPKGAKRALRKLVTHKHK